MNLKGIKIDKKLYRKISLTGVSKLKNNLLYGLDEFKKFCWGGFTKEEFTALISSMDFLYDAGALEKISDNQLFIFNYYTDVAEMDIATVLKDSNENNIILDIEYKSGECSCTKLDEQLISRVTSHMQQLFLNEKYLIICMNDAGFYRMNYYDSCNSLDSTNIDDLLKLFNEFHSNTNVESILTQANNLAGIHKLYIDLENGKFKYYEDTKRTTELILKKIRDGKKAVVCLSNPGTGKTVAAFKLFFENEDMMFLIMNEKFYKALNLSKYFHTGRCFFGTDTFLSNDLSEKIVIIDEAQRLNEDKILEIIQKSKSTIIFGDVSQSFMPNDLCLDGNGLVDYLIKNGIFTHKKELKRSKRYADDVEIVLNYLVSKSFEPKEKIKIEDYKINIFYNCEDFLNEYNTCIGGKKMFTTFNNSSKEFITIGKQNFKMASRDFFDYAIANANEDYIGHTLHAISFDVENNFVYIPDICVKIRAKKYVMTLNNIMVNDEKKITKFLNELNILFTRGKRSLNILVEDLETYLYLKSKLKKISL